MADQIVYREFEHGKVGAMQRRLVFWLVLTGLLALAVFDTQVLRTAPSGVQVALTASEKMSKGKSQGAVVNDSKSKNSSNCPAGAEDKKAGCK